MKSFSYLSLVCISTLTRSYLLSEYSALTEPHNDSGIDCPDKPVDTDSGVDVSDSYRSIDSIY